MQIDECYTLTQRDLKYTIIHLTKKQTLTSVQKMLKKAETYHGIKPTNVFGYDCIAGNDSTLPDHPGMRLMIENMNKRNDSFEYWLLKDDLYSNTRGILYKFLTDVDRSKMTKSQLEFLVKQQERKHKEKVSELRDQLLDCEQCNEELGTQNDELIAENKQLKVQYKKARIEIARLTARLEVFESDSGAQPLDFTPIYRTDTPLYASEDDRHTAGSTSHSLQKPPHFSPPASTQPAPAGPPPPPPG